MNSLRDTTSTWWRSGSGATHPCRRLRGVYWERSAARCPMGCEDEISCATCRWRALSVTSIRARDSDATIPSEMNLRDGTTKYVLKQAMRGVLPDGIIDRPKHGFAVPLGYWFRGKLGAYVRDLLLGDSARRRGLFNGPYIESLVAQH